MTQICRVTRFSLGRNGRAGEEKDLRDVPVSTGVSLTLLVPTSCLPVTGKDNFECTLMENDSVKRIVGD